VSPDSIGLLREMIAQAGAFSALTVVALLMRWVVPGWTFRQMQTRADYYERLSLSLMAESQRALDLLDKVTKDR
jgi:hypothetical protein